MSAQWMAALQVYQGTFKIFSVAAVMSIRSQIHHFFSPHSFKFGCFGVFVQPVNSPVSRQPNIFNPSKRICFCCITMFQEFPEILRISE